MSCKAHPGRCQRVFSQVQLDKFRLGDGEEQLVRWILLAVNKQKANMMRHMNVPKPMPEDDTPGVNDI